MDLYRLQSAELSEGTMKLTTQQNMQFVDAGMSETVAAPSLGPFTPDSDSSSRLGDFLSRPVQINTFNWQEGNTDPIQVAFNPWALYFNDANIKRKLDNFKLIRCKLHLKFVVNASPFYYGALRVSYNPLSDGHDNYQVPGDQIKLSQTPGLFIEPATMTTSELELPFIWPNSWLDIVSNSEFLNMGRIQYVLYAKLRSANAVASAAVRVACYAWATDVEVAGLTTALSLQSDEYEDSGIISGPASAVANIASRLSQAPVIGTMATATAIGAGAVSDIARLFGFSNPPVIDDVKPVAPKSFHAFSSVDTSVPMDKLSLDPKNEVTVDNSVAGDDSNDPLLLQPMLRRESFLQGTLWQGADAENKILWSAPVTPINVSRDVLGSQNIVNHTPSAYFGRCFRQWRGAMTYRFRFVKSRYHTGRLIITWDPHGVPSGDYETTTMVRVVDLQNEDEVVVTIPYKQSAAWLRTTSIDNNYSNGSSPSLTYNPLAHNGVLQVRVLTTLTGPAALPEIDILTFVSCGSDIEMSVPNELPQNYSVFPVQSREGPADELLSASSAVTPMPSVEIVTVGESIKSLRTLLHRASFSETQLAGNPATPGGYVNDGAQQCVNLFSRTPQEYGYHNRATSWSTKYLSPGTTPFAFVTVHPLNWVINCFAGYRGSIVHHFNVETNGVETISYFGAERDDRNLIILPTINGRNRFTVTTALGPSSVARVAVTETSGVRRKTSGQRGMALTNCTTQSALSVVSPQYSAWRFRPAFGPVRDEYPTGTHFEDECLRVDTVFRASSTAATTPWPTIAHYIAAGVDFNPVYFICVPSVYSYNAPSAIDVYTP